MIGPEVSRGTVSCLMVTRDRAALARRAVACFAAQSWRDRELVIIDDGDQDYTDLLEPYRRDGHLIRYVRRQADPAIRLGELRNIAISHAAGEWCIQWDDDEWYHPERIARQMAWSAGHVAVALRWTLMDVDDGHGGAWSFRADTGIATPGTVLHRRDAARYPNLARGEDSEFLRELRRTGPVAVLGPDASHLFVRCFHGTNTWDQRHFVRRLHRRPVDWPSYAIARWWHHDLTRHRAFRLDEAERETIAAVAATRSSVSAHPLRSGAIDG